MATIGPRVRQLRKARSMTQTALGVRMGLAPASASVQVSRWESGARTLSVSTLWEMAYALEVEPFELLRPVTVSGKH